jgi:hypothetical protein
MKPVKLNITFTLKTEVPDGWDDQMIRFHFEENHCSNNHIDRLVEIKNSTPGECSVCCISDVKVVKDRLHFPKFDQSDKPVDAERRRHALQSLSTKFLKEAQAGFDQMIFEDWDIIDMAGI